MKYDETLTIEEIKFINLLQNKNRMEQDEMIFNYERKNKNGNTI